MFYTKKLGALSQPGHGSPIPPAVKKNDDAHLFFSELSTEYANKNEHVFFQTKTD